jgi:two-component system, sensor histidine kinase and response regulator
MPQLSPTLRSKLAGQVLDSLPDAVAVLDGNGGIIWANGGWDGFARQVSLLADGGTGLPDLCEQRAVQGLPDMARMAEGIRLVLEGRSQCFEHTLTLPLEGSTRTYAVRMTRLQAADHGSVVLHVQEPVPRNQAQAVLAEGERQRRNLERQLTEARDRAERASRAKSAFLSSMSHEMRTPLNAIIGFAQLLEIDPEADRSENIREILRAGRHLQELLDEVLDLSRIEQGRVELQLEAIHPEDLITECLALAESEAAAAGVALVPPERSGAVRWVRADRRRLRQVLINLISNAIKYNRPGGRVEISINDRGSDGIVICVSDTGMGIPEERRDELFTPFSRLGREASGIEGTGLGLVISGYLVDVMGGGIDVDSVPGEGSTFRVTLPAARPPEIRQGDVPPVEVTPPALWNRRRTVLYVEDNPANLRLVEQLLSRRRDIRFVGVAHPRDGRAFVLREAPDLIMLDINLPETDGYELLAEMRREPALQATPAIAVSANAMPSDVTRGLKAGFARYLTKPLDMRLFMQTLEELLTES